MGLPKYAQKKDKNEQEIVDALTAIGATVYRIGTPVDLLVGYRARNLLLECKNPSGRNRKTPLQEEFFKTWRGQVRIVRNAEEAIKCVLEAYTLPEVRKADA